MGPRRRAEGKDVSGMGRIGDPDRRAPVGSKRIPGPALEVGTDGSGPRPPRPAVRPRSPQPFAAIALIAATPLSPSGIAAKGPPWRAWAGSRGSGGSLPARIASANTSALSWGA